MKVTTEAYRQAIATASAAEVRILVRTARDRPDLAEIRAAAAAREAELDDRPGAGVGRAQGLAIVAGRDRPRRASA